MGEVIGTMGNKTRTWIALFALLIALLTLSHYRKEAMETAFGQNVTNPTANLKYRALRLVSGMFAVLAPSIVAWVYFGGWREGRWPRKLLIAAGPCAAVVILGIEVWLYAIGR